MRDTRLDKLADVLVSHSMKVKPGDNVMINMRDHDPDFLDALIDKIYTAGGRPFFNLTSSKVSRAVNMGSTEQSVQTLTDLVLPRLREMECSVHFVGEENDYATADVPVEKVNMIRRLYSKPVDDVMREKKTRWVLLMWPKPGMAQKAQMSTEAFEDYFFDVCCVDYQKMDESLKPLKQLMEQTDRVHITGPGTDIEFSVQGIPVVPCAGENNIPDGEIFTAPVKGSVNGTVAFNAPSSQDGFRFEDIRLTFENGKCVDAKANNTERINKMLDTDEGARYIGEFALGVNPRILKPMCDTLFDEKIAGSFHMALGASYDEAPNGNQSAIHWDMVCLQGQGHTGNIEFDGKLVRKDGEFVLPELKPLNA